MTPWLGLVFDAGLAVLLTVTIGYCSRLSARIRLLQDSRSELAGMISQFDQATGRAMTSLAELQNVSKRVGDALQLKIEKANFLADDLAFLVEKSAKLAGRLEEKKPAFGEAALQSPAPVKQPPAEPQARRDYPKPEADADAQSRANASLEALLNRLSSAQAPASLKTAGMQSTGQTIARTQAERELYEALKGG